MSRDVFKSLQELIEGLLDAFHRYRLYLDKHSSAMTASHHSNNEGELHVDKTSLTCIRPFDHVIPEAYESLVRELESKPLYSPLFVQDYSPEDRFERRRWL